VADSSGLIAARLSAQLLAGPPARAAEDVAERLLAVQAQDPRGARLAIRARTRGLTAADVDRALGERSLVITWLNRGTLHLVRAEDYPWLHALTTPPLFAGNARRLAQEGVTPAVAERALAVVERALADEGPLTRAQLRDRLASKRIPTRGQALVQVLRLASLRGIAVRGPMAGREQAYVLVRDWLGEPAPVERGRALAELARRYLAGHGPAGDRDLAKWAGLPLRDARAALEAVASELKEREDGLVDLAGGRRPAPLPAPRLLGAFEPLLLGWTSRDFLFGSGEHRIILGGLFRPFALVRGRAAAAWSIRDGKVVLEPFARLRREDAAALGADAEAVLRYLT
jgi:winged helix DNA-binding protein